MVAAGADLCRKIASIGPYDALIVGGTVRDLLMGATQTTDVDIATNAPVSALERHFRVHDIGRSKDFGIVVVTHGGYPFEVANFRTEAGYSDRRHPDRVTIVSSFEQDSRRRDFTINAIGIDGAGTTIDYHGGIEDIRNRLIRAVGNARDRFEEDALRLVRAIRFAARFGFALESDTESAIRQQARSIRDLSAERLRDELFKAAKSGGPVLANFIRQLDLVGLLQPILPEVKALQGLKHNLQHHPEGHVYEHVLAAVAASPSLDPVDNLAVLFHDLGKATTLGHKEDGEPTYHGHEAAGIPLFDEMAKRLKFSNEAAEKIRMSVSQHMHGHRLDQLSDKLLLKLRQDPNWPTLKNTIYSDEKARLHLFNPESFAAKMNKADQVFQRYGDAREFEARMSALIDGKLILSLVPGAKGPRVGVIKDAVRDWIVERQFEVTPEQVREKIVSVGHQESEQ